jgi:hypothetical protein
LAEAKTRHEEILTLTVQETQQKLSANEGEMDRKQKDLVMGLSSKHELQMIEKDAELKHVLHQLEEQAAAHKRKEEKFEDALNEAVSEAKKHVYAKAEAQFTAGNAKYQAVKGQLKDTQAELATATAELEAAAHARNALSVLQAKHDVISKELTQLVLVINDPSVVVEGKTICGSDYYGTKDAIELLKSQQASVQELTAQVTELTSSKKLLETMIIEKETNIIQLNADHAALKEALAVKQIELKASQELLVKIEKESELQLVVVAKLTTEKEGVEGRLQEALKEQEELTARCTNLRNMNSELMTMLEANE